MNDKKVYAIVTTKGRTYAAHIGEWEVRWKFDSHKIVSKAEYQKARADGMPSWGERETTLKMGKFPT